MKCSFEYFQNSIHLGPLNENGSSLLFQDDHNFLNGVNIEFNPHLHITQTP